MANQWLRLWHDMPNDPKWRTISRISNQSICDVIAVYTHMLVTASNAVKRGNITNWKDEDIASALDLETEQVIAIREAMQGRVLDGECLRGWDQRQPKREDNSSGRVREYRERKKQDNAPKRNVTQCNAPDKDTDKIKNSSLAKANSQRARVSLDDLSVDHIAKWLAEKRTQGRYIHHDEFFVLEQFKQYCKSKGKTYADYIQAYRGAFEWDRCQPKFAGAGGRATKDDRARDAIRRASGLLGIEA